MKLGRAPQILLPAGFAIEYEVDGLLRLRGSLNQKLVVIMKLLQPASNVRGLILDDRVRDSSFGANVSGAHFRA